MWQIFFLTQNRARKEKVKKVFEWQRQQQQRVNVMKMFCSIYLISFQFQTGKCDSFRTSERTNTKLIENEALGSALNEYARARVFVVMLIHSSIFTPIYSI